MNGILYMLAGGRHANLLVVSIYSLRSSGQTYPVHIAAGDDEGERVAKLICADQRLAPVTYHRWGAPKEKRNDKYRAKTFMDQLTPFESTVFLDADTLVGGDIAPLFSTAFPVTLTQFADWKSNGKKISGRISPWADVAAEDVRKMLSAPLPAINTGVMAFDKSAAADKFFREWRDLTAKKCVFICDELSCQLIFHRHACRVLDDRWNASPIHSERAKSGEAMIYHFHGSKHAKREQGRKIWLPWYDRCCRENVAGIADWTPAGDKHLREYLEERDGKRK